MAMGHNPNTITAANTVILFRCIGVYDSWVQITGAQSDQFLSMSDVTVAQTRMGVDGKQSIGYTPHETPLTLSLEANSPSLMVFETVQNTFNKNMETAFCEIQVQYPSVKRRQTFKGAMVTKQGGTGISQLLVGGTFNFNMVSGGIEEIN